MYIGVCISKNGDGPTVLIIKDTEGSIYGGYASQPWQRQSDFYGDMKSFLFQLFPKASIFRPTGSNNNLQWVRLNKNEELLNSSSTLQVVMARENSLLMMVTCKFSSCYLKI